VSTVILIVSIGLLGTGGFFFFTNQDRKKMGLIFLIAGFILLLVWIAMFLSVFFFRDSPNFKNEF
jgi:hypothetical protein